MEVVQKKKVRKTLIGVKNTHNLLIYYHQMLIDLLTQTLKHLNTFVISLKRMREKMDPGNWELHLSGSSKRLETI